MLLFGSDFPMYGWMDGIGIYRCGVSRLILMELSAKGGFWRCVSLYKVVGYCAFDTGFPIWESRRG